MTSVTDDWVLSTGGIITLTALTGVMREKRVLVPVCSPQIAHRLTGKGGDWTPVRPLSELCQPEEGNSFLRTEYTFIEHYKELTADSDR